MVKAKRYILSIAVLLVWGAIVYKVVGIISEPNSQPPIVTPKTKALQVMESDLNYELKLNYKDPFTKEHPAVKEKHANETEIIPIEVVWPSIEYKGSIYANKQIKAILEIDQKLYTLKQGEKVNGLLLVNIKEETVTLTYRTEKRIFNRTR